MKNRTKLIFLAFFLVVIIFLIICTFIRTPECNYTHVDEMISFVVPDEEIARKIADVVMGIGDEKDYDVIVSFDKKSDEWVITYMPKSLPKNDKESAQRVVRIRRDIGTIILYDN